MLTTSSGRPLSGKIGDLIVLIYPDWIKQKRVITVPAYSAAKLKYGQPRSRSLGIRGPVPLSACNKWRIFGRDPIGPKYRYMQQEVTLYELQMSQASDTYALISGYRVSVDYAQAAVHFYKGEQEWGKLAGTLPVEKWSGDWLIRTIGRFFRIEYQLAQDKAIASIQRNGYLTVQTIHRIGRAVLYRRSLVERDWDYCMSYRNEVGFGSSVDLAIAELRSKLKSRTMVEQAEITLNIGPGSRFTELQLAEFCQANSLTPGGHYTRQQLRQTILQQRKVNCEQFRNQLQYFDIRINCK